MRRALQIAARELLQNRRDGLAALFTIVLPVVFTVFLGLIFGGAATTTFPLAVVDSDRSEASQEFIQRLKESSVLRVVESELGDVEDAVKNQKVAAGLLIPEGFGAALAPGRPGGTAALTLVRVETSSGAQSVQQAVAATVSRYNAVQLAAVSAADQISGATGVPPDAGLLQQATTVADAELSSPAITVTPVEAGSAGSEIAAQGFDQSSTGGLVNWVLFGIMGVASMTVWERKQGLLKRLDVVGVGAPQIIGGKMMAMVAVTLLQQFLLVLVGEFVLGVDYLDSPLALLLVMLSLSAMAASFGLFVSVLFRSEQAVIATTVISSLMLAAIGGAWFPLEVTGAGFSRFAHVLPSAWVMDSLHGITLGGWGVSDVLLPVAIVWAWAVALFGLAIWRYRPE